MWNLRDSSLKNLKMVIFGGYLVIFGGYFPNVPISCLAQKTDSSKTMRLFCDYSTALESVHGS